MASIRPRKQSKTGRTTYQVRGANGKHLATFDTRDQAKDFITGMDHDRLTGRYVDPTAGRVTFGEWWDEWSTSRTGLRASTVARDQAYGRSLVLPALQDLELRSIDPLTAQRFANDLAGSGRAPATVHKAVQLAGGALRAAVRQRLVAVDPFVDVQLPRIEKATIHFLTPKQVALLADTIQPAYRPLILLAAYGGLRFGELAGLRRGQVDLVKRQVRITDQITEVRGELVHGAPKTAAGRRVVPLPRLVADALHDHCAHITDMDALVFTAPRGGPLRITQWRKRVFQPAVHAAGLAPLRIHDLRHTACALWIAAGATPLAIAHRAGHASVVVVLDRYGHLLPGLEDQVTDRLDELATLPVEQIATVHQLPGVNQC